MSKPTCLRGWLSGFSASNLESDQRATEFSLKSKLCGLTGYSQHLTLIQLQMLYNKTPKIPRVVKEASIVTVSRLTHRIIIDGDYALRYLEN